MNVGFGLILGIGFRYSRVDGVSVGISQDKAFEDGLESNNEGRGCGLEKSIGGMHGILPVDCLVNFSRAEMKLSQSLRE